LFDFNYICKAQYLNDLAKNFILEQLIEQFKEERFFKRESLFAFYRQFDPDLKD
jgi:hypothetical protein